MSNRPTKTRNIKNVTGVTVYNVKIDDDIINIDTSLNTVSVYLPNIKGSGLNSQPKDFFINDLSGNANVNNITIIGVGGDLINGGASTLINKNQGSAICTICRLDEWLISKDNDGEPTLSTLAQVLVVGNKTDGTNIDLGVDDLLFNTGSSLIRYDSTLKMLVLVQDINGVITGVSGALGIDGGYGTIFNGGSTTKKEKTLNPSDTFINESWAGVNSELKVIPLNQTAKNTQSYQNNSGVIELVPKIVTVKNGDSPYTATWGEDINIDTSGGAVIINLPTAIGNSGYSLNIVKNDSSINKVTFVASGVEAILTNLAHELTSQYESLKFISNGTDIGIR